MCVFHVNGPNQFGVKSIGIACERSVYSKYILADTNIEILKPIIWTKYILFNHLIVVKDLSLMVANVHYIWLCWTWATPLRVNSLRTNFQSLQDVPKWSISFLNWWYWYSFFDTSARGFLSGGYFNVQEILYIYN